MEISDKPALIGKLESILFVAGKPLRFKHLAEACEVTVGDIEAALNELQQRYSQEGRGFFLIIHEGEAALATHPANTELVRQFLKKEELGELTRPQLEALSVITYRGPILKSELEQIRGVNCSLILRNLQIRGLVETVGDEAVIPRYQVTIDFLRFLGVKSVKELPNYESLSTHENLERILATTEKTQA